MTSPNRSDPAHPDPAQLLAIALGTAEPEPAAGEDDDEATRA